MARKTPPIKPNPPPAPPKDDPQVGFQMRKEQFAALGPSEWLLTNGLGGFAMGTASGIPERRYHGWLVAATHPPLGRVMALHSCVEWLVLEHAGGTTTRHALSAYRFAGGTIHPEGLDYLTTFERREDFARWTYDLGNFKVTRTLRLQPGTNAAIIEYQVHPAPAPSPPFSSSASSSSSSEISNLKFEIGRPRAHLELRPFIPLRDFHWLGGSHATIAANTATAVELTSPAARLTLESKNAAFRQDPQVWRNFDYRRDRERGMDSTEDLFSPGIFESQPGATEVTLRAHMPGLAPQRDHARSNAPASRLPAPLAAAADQFIVQRQSESATLTSIIAGYPWFSDWGRDSFISMRGLLLATGRHDQALELLEAFASHQRRGLIPNCFDDGSGTPQYNTVDASLWYIHAACEYLRVTMDRPGFEHIHPACLAVIDAYRNGTDFDIRMDADGLITAGNDQTQLTWMDAKRNGVVFTPRHGKAVEINALWHSALLELAEAIAKQQPDRAKDLRQLAARAARSFEAAFWDPQRGCLFDVLTPNAGAWVADEKIRPNQIFAVSQPFSPLPPEKRAAVVACVGERLLTPMGLRTLDPADPGYIPRFEGPMMQRDAAYHNGTVWPWLIGPYCEAVLRVGAFSAAAKSEVRQVLAPLLGEFTRRPTPGPILQLAEVYDGEPVSGHRRPEGCMAQAWSIAEVLRILTILD